MSTETAPPPPPLTTSPPRRGSPARPGGWALATMLFWGAVFVAVVGVWKASQELGVATWWRGPRSAPRPVLVQILPLVAPSVMVIGAVFRWRALAWLGIGASIVTAAIGAGDIGRVTPLALVEVALGVAGLVFSLAALAGQAGRSRR